MEKEVEVQEINGVDYFIVSTREFNGKKYVSFAQLDKPRNVLFAEEIEENGTEYFRIIENYSDEYMEITPLFANLDM